MIYLMIVFGKEVAEWVYQKTGGFVGPATAGLGWVKDNKLIAGIAVEAWNGHNLFIHQRIDSPPPKAYWFSSLDWCFNRLGCSRITGITPSDNHKALKLNRNIGFENEAVLKGASDDGKDLIIQVLWKDKCRMLGWCHG